MSKVSDELVRRYGPWNKGDAYRFALFVDGAKVHLDAGAIAAARAVLDVAEDLVRDPRTAAAVSGLIGSAAGGARRPRNDPDDEDGVQRIPVS